MNFRKVSGVLAVAFTIASMSAPLLLTPDPKGLVVLEAKPTTPIVPRVLPNRKLGAWEITTTNKVIKKDIKQVEVVKHTSEVPLSRGGTIEPKFEEVSTMTGFQVTWYSNQYDNSNVTKSGAITTAGRTVAVDPRVIPLGTWIEIYMPDGRVFTRRAEDTGSAVKGRIIDIYADQPESVLNARGRTHNVTVKIVRRK